MAGVKFMVMYPRPQDIDTSSTFTRTRMYRSATDSRPNTSVRSRHSRSSIRRSTCR